jgi:hypothetical protein
MPKSRFNASFAAALLLLILGAQTSADPTTQPTTQPSPRILIVRWSLLLNETGLDAVKQLDSQPVKSDSKIYDAAIYSAEALRGAIAQAKDSSGLEAGSPDVAFALPFPGGLNLQRALQIQSWQDRDTRVSFGGFANGNESWSDAPQNQIHGKLRYQTIHVDLTESDNRGQPTPPIDGSISFDGNLSAGQALVYVAPINAASGNIYDHLIVWEAFTGEPWQVAYLQSIQDSVWWCQNGPDQAIDLVNNAAVWAARATHDADSAPDAYQQKLEDGKIVAVAAICNLEKWPLCFWDGAGQPVYEPNQIDLNPFNISDPSQAWVTLHGDKSEWKASSPLGKSQQANQTSPYTYSDTFDVDPTGQVVIGISTGPWSEIGEVKPSGSILINGTKYRLRRLESMGETGIYTLFNSNRGAIFGDASVALTAVLKDGTEVDADQAPAALIGLNWGTDSPSFQSITKDQIKTFHVWTRKRAWITIANVPDQPADEPKADATQADADAAQANLESRFPAAKHDFGGPPAAAIPTPTPTATPEQLAAWFAILPEPHSPLGAMRALVIAAKKGDTDGVRQRLYVAPGIDPKILDLVARQMVAMDSLVVDEIARFGADNVKKLRQADPTLNTADPDSRLAATTWLPQSDGGLRGTNAVLIVKGSDGQFYLDVGQYLHQQTDLAPIVKMMETRIQKDQMLDQYLKQNPSATFDQYSAEVIAVKSQLATGSGSPSTSPAATQNSAPPSK